MSKKVKKWSNKNIFLVSLLVILIVAMGTVFGFYKHVKNKIYIEKKPTVSSDTEYTEVKGITNVLLIGVDSRDLDEQSRSDSMIIATLDSNNKKVKLTSLFRDTLVNIPGYGEAKLNAAYMLGGADLLLETIKETYNINIDKYAIINFWGFEAIIDQIGGIEVEVKDYQLEELNKYIGESTGGNDCPVENAGVQVLNGKQALSYARIRYNVGDEYERTDRQREVLFKVAEKLKETKPSKYLGIMNSMLDYIKTNIDPLEALNMAYTIFKFPSLDTEQLQMPLVALSEARNYKDLGAVFLMDRLQNAEVLYKFIYEDKLPVEEELDYDSLAIELQKYLSEEATYNQIYNINPNDYTEVEDGNVQNINDENIYTPYDPVYVPEEQPSYVPEEKPQQPSDSIQTPTTGEDVTEDDAIKPEDSEDNNDGTAGDNNATTEPINPEQPDLDGNS